MMDRLVSMIRCLFGTGANTSAKTDKTAKKVRALPKQRGTDRDAEPPGVRVDTERLSLDSASAFHSGTA